MDNNIKKIRIGLIAGIFLAFFGFTGIMAGDFIAGLALFIPGLILIPQIGKFIENKLNLKLTKVIKIIFVVVGLFICGYSIDSQDSKQPEKQTATQENTSQLNAVEEAKVENAKPIQAEIATPEPENKQQEQPYSVLSVVDGDTVQVDIDGKEEVLRLIGINTPETVDPRKPVECFGKEASNKAKELLTGKKVKIEVDSTQGELDKYNRLLRYVILEDGTNFNKKMIEDGYAYEYTYDIPYKYQNDFKEAEKNARESKRGLWAEDTCNGELTMNKAEKTPAPASTQSTKTANSTTSKNNNPTTGTCTGKRTCGQMSNCEEAYFYLNNCGVSSLDRDKDGIPCETICN